MTHKEPGLRPPRAAVWFVDLFASRSQAESILGDLLEEFSDIASKSGAASGRRWFWQHSLKTIAHLAVAQFRTGLSPIVSAVALGFLLRRLGLSNPEGFVVAILRIQRPYSNLHYDFYVWMVTWGIPIVGAVESVAVGCAVAAVARGREVIAALTMSMASAVFVTLSFCLLLRHLPTNVLVPWPLLLLNVENWIAVVLGAVLVRKFRSASAHRLSTH